LLDFHSEVNQEFDEVHDERPQPVHQNPAFSQSSYSWTNWVLNWRNYYDQMRFNEWLFMIVGEMANNHHGA
jgi:hypothetical protein